VVSAMRLGAILIVEDQTLIALAVEDVVRDMGANMVGRASELSQGLVLVETTAWDAAFLDVELANGELSYPLAERLRTKGVAFAFLTGSDGEIDARYVDVPLLKKPFSLRELESCLNGLLTAQVEPAARKAA
jgi:DNA-binding response OmpR family regulator